MSPGRQCIAIAEALGPKLIHYENNFPVIHLGGDWFEPFDPLNDLNAMHEAEKVLTRDQCEEYMALLEITYDPAIPASDYDFWAPAAQRAEAFLRTIGKWADT